MIIDLSQFDKMTKGPWRVEEGTTLIWGACNRDDNSSYGMGYPVAEAQMPRRWNGDNPTTEEIDTNARAIASLPDLIAELKRTREALEIAREYLEDAQDVNWEGTGPNDQMKCLAEINEAMEKR